MIFFVKFLVSSIQLISYPFLCFFLLKVVYTVETGAHKVA